jgi:hypothetical protein
VVLSRQPLVFGGWWLFSGLMHFLSPDCSRSATSRGDRLHQGADRSGLFTWIKVIEVVLGLTMLANRAMPLTVIALVPLNVVIVYWNFVLDEGAVEWTFGRAEHRAQRGARLAVAALLLSAARVARQPGLFAATEPAESRHSTNPFRHPELVSGPMVPRPEPTWSAHLPARLRSIDAPCGSKRLKQFRMTNERWSGSRRPTFTKRVPPLAARSASQNSARAPAAG